MRNPFKTKNDQQQAQPNEYVIVGHLIKYNLYLLAKSVVFSAVLKHTGDIQGALNETDVVMGELDLDLKRKSTTN